MLRRGIDYFRAKAGTVYKLKRISVATDPKNGPWITRDFIAFGEHGKVTVDIASDGGTPENKDFKFWRFPVETFCLPDVHPLLKDLHKLATDTGGHSPDCGAKDDQGRCIDYCTCGGWDKELIAHECKDSGFLGCQYPCRHCLVWSGYGYENVEELAALLQCAATVLKTTEG